MRISDWRFRRVLFRSRHGRQLVADRERRPTVNRGLQRKGTLVSWLRCRRAGHHRGRAMQRVLERPDDDGAPLPELRELGILRKVTPEELTDAWRGSNHRFHFWEIGGATCRDRGWKHV